MLSDAVQKIQAKLGYNFQKTDNLKAALTHSSTGASSTGTNSNYERLEFLGDRVLGLIIAQTLFEEFLTEPEGDLAKRHAALVQGKTIARVAKHIGLGDLMHLSDAERAAGGEQNDNILTDVMEAIIGALYLDLGIEASRKVILNLWGELIFTMKTPPQDPKTALQEWAQGRGLPLPAYELVGRDGPDHAPVFEIKVTVEGYPPWSSKGTSRRKAEKDAAGMLLAHLEEME